MVVFPRFVYLLTRGSEELSRLLRRALHRDHLVYETIIEPEQLERKIEPYQWEVTTINLRKDCRLRVQVWVTKKEESA